MTYHRLLLPVAAAVAVSLIAASAAEARVTYVTYRGVITDGHDTNGLFGAPAASLAGATFTARFLLNDADFHAGVSYQPPLSSSFEFFDTWPIGGRTSAAFWINGKGIDLDCANAGDYCGVSHNNSAGAGGVWGVDTHLGSFGVDTYFGEVWRTRLNLGLSSTTNPFVPDFDFHTPFFHAFAPGDVGGGRLEISDEFVYSNVTKQNVLANLTVLSVAVDVPEPATWALMILGFGAVGVALRRRAFSATAA